jgi:hypothetical protein
MHFENSADRQHQGTEMLRQWVGACERELLQVPSNSIRQVREGR